MKDMIGANKTRLARKHFAVLAFCLVAINAMFMVFSASGAINYFVAFGIIPITLTLCAFALLIAVARSRCRP